MLRRKREIANCSGAPRLGSAALTAIKTITEESPEAREEKALEESLAEGEIIYRSVRQDGTLDVVFRGERPFLDWLVALFISTFIGNSVGGVALVAALAHEKHAPDGIALIARFGIRLRAARCGATELSIP